MNPMFSSPFSSSLSDSHLLSTLAKQIIMSNHKQPSFLIFICIYVENVHKLLMSPSFISQSSTLNSAKGYLHLHAVLQFQLDGNGSSSGPSFSLTWLPCTSCLLLRLLFILPYPYHIFTISLDPWLFFGVSDSWCDRWCSLTVVEIWEKIVENKKSRKKIKNLTRGCLLKKLISENEKGWELYQADVQTPKPQKWRVGG